MGLQSVPAVPGSRVSKHATRSLLLLQGRPALVFGDTVYLRSAANAEGAEFGAAVVAVEAARVFLALPPAFWIEAAKAGPLYTNPMLSHWQTQHQSSLLCRTTSHSCIDGSRS